MPNKIERLKKFDDKTLIDVVKNYRQYGYDDQLRNAAILILEERGFTKEYLKLTGNLENHTYKSAEKIYFSFGRNSKIAFVMYLVLLTTNILVPVLATQYKTFALVALIVNWTSLVLYFVFLIKSFVNQNQFYKISGKKNEGFLLYFLLGIPFYILTYFYFRSQMKEQMKLIK